MKYSTLVAFLFCSPAMILGSHHNEDSTVSNLASTTNSEASTLTMYNQSLPLLESEGVVQGDPPWQTHCLSPQLQQFIFELNGLDGKEVLVRRQAAGGLGGGAGPVDPATLPTQAPTVTTYVLDGTPIPYTQTFRPIPEQWPSPSAGSIGLGTHTGEVGAVRTNKAGMENFQARKIGAMAAGAGVGGFLLL